MTTALALLSLFCVAGLIATVCAFVHRLDALLRSAEDAVRTIKTKTHLMRRDSTAISAGVEAMNGNLYRVAMHLGQDGEAAEALAAEALVADTDRG